MYSLWQRRRQGRPGHWPLTPHRPRDPPLTDKARDWLRLQTQLQTLFACIHIPDIELHIQARCQTRQRARPHFKGVEYTLKPWFELNKHSKLGHACHRAVYLLTNLIACLRLRPDLWS